MAQEILHALCEKYRELEESCYRAAVAGRSEHGRLGGRYRLPAPLLKKLDLDQALEGLYGRFFGGTKA